MTTIPHAVFGVDHEPHCPRCGYGLDFPEEIVIVNVTPHPIRMACACGPYEVPPSGIVISATATEVVVGRRGAATLVSTIFEPSVVAGYDVLKQIKAALPRAIVVGSIIAAQAYPGEVVAMIAEPGYERRPPEEKLMRPDRFTVFDRERKEEA